MDSTNRQVICDNVEWFSPNESPIVTRDSPDLSLHSATTT
ncbi:uncharacterized protein G2W53_039566 [Senna tora]|uniref:Uncharacterized protein n=1 Tax=Senna tora TaxID=362788 RepID=A0A834SR25_9FABA|nr:uncharacterized protein G2W53_039566 [Senna tora]